MVEKTKKMAIVIGLILIGVVLSAGCADKAEQEEAVGAPPGEATTTSTQSSTAPPSGAGTSLSDLLDNAKGSTSATYDLVMSGGPIAETITSKVWSTETKERMESTVMGQKSITIIDKEKQVMYMYDPDQNMAMKMDFSGTETTGPAQSFSEIMGQYNPTTVGTETIDGKKCTVIEYESTVGDATVTQKMWVWQKYGFPIRVEMTSSLMGTPVTTVMEMKNIDFGHIPDNTFELPKGVEIMEMPSMSSLPEGA
jgi:outer membrane lipoprotein-sorting protein